MAGLAPGDVRVRVLGSALGAHPGAEVAGQVIEAGEAAKEWIGRLVVVPRLLTCGECGACQRGRVAACSQRRPRPPVPIAQEDVPARFLLPLGPPLLDEERAVSVEEAWRYAALADALAAPHAGLVRAGLGPGDLCVVIGEGARAGAAVLVARALGAQAVALCWDETVRQRLCAPPFSALTALDGRVLDPQGAREAVRAIAAEAGLGHYGLCLLETTGSDAGRARAIGMMEVGATAVLMDRRGGVTGMAAPLPAGPGLAEMAALERLCQDGGLVIGAGPPHPDLLPELLALVLRAQIPLTDWIAEIPPAEIDAAMARRGEGVHLRIARFG